VSQGDGRFDVAALAPGRYVVRVSLAGFATQVLENVELTLGSRLDLDVQLTLPTPNEQIVVRADVPALDVQRTAGSTVVGQAQLEALPINGRNFVSLSLITPAVTVDRVPQQGAAAGSGLTFVGQRRALEQHHGGRARQHRRQRGQRPRGLQPGRDPGVPGGRALLHPEFGNATAAW
jgi:hypothetical protein